MPTRTCRGTAAAVVGFGDRLDQLQPRPDRPLSIVLMRLRIAEIN